VNEETLTPRWLSHQMKYVGHSGRSPTEIAGSISIGHGWLSVSCRADYSSRGGLDLLGVVTPNEI
jgi:hypothetical protein